MATRATVISVDEYLASTHKPDCEYLDGVLRRKAMPGYKHAKMELRVYNLINELGLGFEAVPEQTVRICIEVLSPEDRFSETVAKCEESHAWGVPCCRMIDPEEKQCREYRAGGRPHEAPVDGKIAAQEIALNAADLFAGF